MSVVPEEAARWLSGEASDPRLTATLTFVAEIARQRTHVSEIRIAALRQAGVGDALMLEIVAHIALNAFTNTVNHVARTAVDFPPVALPDTGTAA
jgi:alkylhydroperoxidase family enzyme